MQIVGARDVVRGSICETTAISRFSPSDSTSATELGRPTLSGSSAFGKSTVSRTARTEISSRPGGSSGGVSIALQD